MPITLLFSEPILYVELISVLVVSMIIHELAHGWVAVFCGDDTPICKKRITLNPVAYFGWFSLLLIMTCGFGVASMEVNTAKLRWERKLIPVLLAGSISNLVLAGCCIGIAKLSFLTSSNWFYPASKVCLIAALINLALGFLNLLPIPPLDGFQVIAEIFPVLRFRYCTLVGLFLLAVSIPMGLASSLAQFSLSIIDFFIS